MRRGATVLLLGFVLSAPVLAGTKDRLKDSFSFLFGGTPTAEKLGTRLADNWLGLAETRTAASLYDGPDCTAAELPKLEKGVCKRTDATLARAEKLREKINEAYAGGKMNSYAAWENTAESWAFRQIQSRLLDPNPRMRWEALNAQAMMCEHADLGTPLVQRQCAEELERAASTVLKVDDVAFNRHLALELLARSGASSEDAREQLQVVVGRGRPATRECISILEHRGKGQLEAVAKGYQGGVFSCETPLAARALQQGAGSVTASGSDD